MRVSVLYTGGTLGMVDTPRGLAPGADLGGWLRRMLTGTELADDIDLASFDRLIDSSTTTPDDWQAVIEQLWRREEESDAFVVLHGTDTMAYTSAALSYALTDFGKPVVLTGAQLPLGVVGSDAAPNVTGALRAAVGGQAHGVSIFFGHQLLAGNRVTKSSSWAFGGFNSPNAPALAVAGAPWQWSGHRPEGVGWPGPAPYRRCDVAVLSVAPGITARRVEAMLDPLPEGVIVRAYGVGNIPDEAPGLVGPLTEVIESGVPVVVNSQCGQAEVMLGHYATGYELERAGAVGAGDMTLEASYAKLVFLLSQGCDARGVTRWMGTSIAGELTERSPA